MATQILDLSTLTDRPAIRIDGQPYELRNPGELSVMTTRRLQVLWKRMQEMEKIDAPTAQDDEEYLRVAQDYAGLVVVDLPDAVRLKLNVPHVVAITSAFYGLPQTAPTVGAPPVARPSKNRTGAKSSRR
jgi:hypothetical protein